MPKTVEVYHTEPFGDPSAPLVHVASVSVVDHLSVEAALEYAYRWTNNIDGSWSRRDLAPNNDFNPAVTVIAPLPVTDDGKTLGLRSSSMGDRFVVDGKNYRCAMFGFEPENADGTANIRNI